MIKSEPQDIVSHVNNLYEIILTEKEATILWNWLRWQSLPYDNYPLKDLVRQLGDFIEPSKI